MVYIITINDFFIPLNMHQDLFSWTYRFKNPQIVPQTCDCSFVVVLVGHQHLFYFLPLSQKEEIKKSSGCVLKKRHWKLHISKHAASLLHMEYFLVN